MVTSSAQHIDRKPALLPIFDFGHGALTGLCDETPAIDPSPPMRGEVLAFPALKGDYYPLAFQFKNSPDAKTITARMTYDATACSACQKPEWVCICAAETAKKSADKD